MNGYKRLSTEIINKYDYKKTKRNVDKFMAPLCEKVFIYRNLTPPSVSSHIKDVCVQESRSNSSSTERYIIKKLETEAEVKEYFDEIQSVIDEFNDGEKLCFKAEYLNQVTIEMLMEKSDLSESTIKRLRQSCIIKFALAFDIAVLKKGK